MKSNKQVTAATMKDVALKAKVSTATVSRALMNPDKVSQSTRSRVEQAALEVGYFPQSMGRNVKRNESRTILVIVPDICDPFFSEIIRGIEVTAAEQGYLPIKTRKKKPFLISSSPNRSTAWYFSVPDCPLTPALRSSAICLRW